MEKQGVIYPGVTPDGESEKKQSVKETVERLDSDLAKQASERVSEFKRNSASRKS